MASFNEIADAAQDQDNIILCRCSSGHSVAYQPLHFHHITNGGKLVFKTDEGTSIQVRDFYGNAILPGKFEHMFYFVAIDNGRTENENYFFFPTC